MFKLQLVFVVLTILTVALLSPAHAQERDPAAAQALFDQGQALMNAGRYAQACAKLAESLRLDPGIGTRFNLAVCHEHEGKVASAWAGFLEVVSLANAEGQAARAQTAQRRASLLEARLPKLVVSVPQAAETSGLEITRGGVIVGSAQWGLAMPVDPGEHRIEVTAPGKRAFAGAVMASEGATVTFEVAPLEPATVAEGEPVPSTSTLPHDAAPLSRQEAVSQTRADVRASESSSGPSGLVIGLGIGGLVAVGAGTTLALLASSKNDSSKEHCDPDNQNLCEQVGVDLRDDARLFGNLATVGFAVGAAALTTAVVLWATGDDEATADGEAALRVGVLPEGALVSVQARL